MDVIQIAKVNILVEFTHRSSFKSLDKYIVDEIAEYSILTKKDYAIELPDVEPIQTEYYDLYKTKDISIQIQREGNTLLGYIIYLGKTILLKPLVDTFTTEYLLSQYAISYIMAFNQALIFHGSSFIYKDMGIILSAKSGTGKSTHSRLWQKYENVVVINDDKNILKIEGNDLICYSSLWSGKHQLDNNVAKKLSCIVFLYQNKENVLTKLTKIEAFKRLITQLVLPTMENKELWNKIMDKLLELPIFLLGCNMEKDAYLTLKNGMDEVCY